MDAPTPQPAAQATLNAGQVASLVQAFYDQTTTFQATSARTS